jgi:Tfp pilus assembly protein PilX
MTLQRAQEGAALMSVIFLIVVIGLLGAFAIQGTTSQQQMANLALLEARADAAAYSGADYAAHELQNGRPCPAQLPLPAIPAIPPPGMDNVTIAIACVVINTPMGAVNDIIATARFGAFGNSEYVQRVNRRRVGAIGTGTWQQKSQERFP